MGYVAFDDVPGFSTVVGAGLIVVAGLILLRQDRERWASSSHDA